MAIVANLLFRLSWTLSISPTIINHVKSPLIPLLIGTLEILRRCMWNFFRIEKEHIVNCRNYAVTKDIQKDIDRLSESGDVMEGEGETENSLPYFINSKESGIHEVDIVVRDSVEEVKRGDVSQLQEQYPVLVKKERELIDQYNTLIQPLLTQ